jgi:translation initiation factor 1A
MPQYKTCRNGKNNKNRDDQDHLHFKETGQEYAKVIRILGGCNLEVFCYDGKTRIAHIRGKMRKRQWIRVGDTILIGLRDFQINKCDVLHKYRDDHIKRLIQVGEINHIHKDRDIIECSFDFDDI